MKIADVQIGTTYGHVSWRSRTETDHDAMERAWPFEVTEILPGGKVNGTLRGHPTEAAARDLVAPWGECEAVQAAARERAIARRDSIIKGADRREAARLQLRSLFDAAGVPEPFNLDREVKPHRDFSGIDGGKVETDFATLLEWLRAAQSLGEHYGRSS